MIGEIVKIALKESFNNDRIKKLIAVGILGAAATGLGMMTGYTVKVANGILTQVAKEATKDICNQME